MIVAIVDNNLVSAIQTINDPSVDGGTGYQTLAQAHQLVIDITDLVPQPQVGWTFNGSQLISNGAAISWQITKLSMLQRFNTTERLGILTYVSTNPSSVPAMLLQNIMVTTYIDLSRSDTQAGVWALVSLGLITSGRATQILTTPPSPTEAYMG